MGQLELADLVAAGVQFGHQVRWWNPKMKKYIFTTKNNTCIINLKETIAGMQRAANLFKSIALKGGKILFVGTRYQMKEIFRQDAQKLGQYYVVERWLGGMLTNIETVRKSVSRLIDIEAMQADGTFDALSKKEVIKLVKEMKKLENHLGGIRDMNKMPDAVYIIDIKKDRIALAEAKKLGIPIVAIVDTNCDPDGIDYMIPANDDSIRGIGLITGYLGDAFAAGDLEYKEKLREQKEQEAKKALEQSKIKEARKAYIERADSKISAEKVESQEAESATTDEAFKASSGSESGHSAEDSR